MLKKVKNFKIWVYREMNFFFILDTLKFVSNDSKTRYFELWSTKRSYTISFKEILG